MTPMDQILKRVSAEHDRDREPVGSPHVERDARNAGLVFKQRENALVPVRTDDVDASEADARNSAAWNAWIARHLENERAAVIDIITRTIGQFASEYVHEKLQPLTHELGVLRNENTELRGMLASTLAALDTVRKNVEGVTQERIAEERARQIRDETVRERSARIADLQRENAASHAELARKQRDQELAQRDARLEQLETRLDMLCRFLSVAGADFPRGF